MVGNHQELYHVKKTIRRLMVSFLIPKSLYSNSVKQMLSIYANRKKAKRTVLQVFSHQEDVDMGERDELATHSYPPSRGSTLNPAGSCFRDVSLAGSTSPPLVLEDGVRISEPFFDSYRPGFFSKVRFVTKTEEVSHVIWRRSEAKFVGYY